MKNSFWFTVVVLVVLLATLGFIRVSPVKQNEQDVIAEMQAAQTPGSVRFFQLVSDYGKYINIGIPLGFLVLGLSRGKKHLIRNGFMILLAMGLAGAILQTIKRTLKEPRPYEVDSRITQWSVGGSNSFPSGHTAEVTASMLGVTLILVRAPWSLILGILWALLMMLSRIVLGVHNFSDILGGIVTGCLAMLIMQKIFDKLWMEPKQEPV